MPSTEQLKTVNLTSCTYFQPHVQFPFLKLNDTHFIEQTPGRETVPGHTIFDRGSFEKEICTHLSRLILRGSCFK